MTEEEFTALLKLEGKGRTLQVTPKTIWTAELRDKTGLTSMDWWASSENKEVALDILVLKYFEGGG